MEGGRDGGSKGERERERGRRREGSKGRREGGREGWTSSPGYQFPVIKMLQTSQKYTHVHIIWQLTTCTYMYANTIYVQMTFQHQETHPKSVYMFTHMMCAHAHFNLNMLILIMNNIPLYIDGCTVSMYIHCTHFFSLHVYSNTVLFIYTLLPCMYMYHHFVEAQTLYKVSIAAGSCHPSCLLLHLCVCIVCVCVCV